MGRGDGEVVLNRNGYFKKIEDGLKIKYDTIIENALTKKKNLIAVKIERNI